MMNEEVLTATSLDRSKAPTPGPLPKVSFPDYTVTTLGNGLRLLIVRNNEQPIVSATLYVRGGSSVDPVSDPGLIAMVADLMTKGTTSRNALQIAEEIDFLGASLNASASWDAVTVSCSALSKYVDRAFAVFADVVLNSTFPEPELERVRLQRLAGLKQAKADAGYLADSVFSRATYNDHAYGHQASGTERSTAEVQRTALDNCYRRYFGPNNAFLVIAGDVEERQITDLAQALFGAWKPLTGVSTELSTPAVTRGRHVGLVEKEAAVQSAIRVGHVGIPRNSADYIAVSAMNMALGGYFGSRINMNLREKNGFTYGARSYYDARMAAGPFVVSTEVRTDVTVRAIEEIVNELTRMARDPITDDELAMVKNYMIGSFPLQLETPQQVAGRVAMIELYGLDGDYFDTYRDKLAALTKDDLFAAAKKYIRPEDLVLVASGNVPALKDGMQQFGPVTLYDTEAQQIG